MQYEEVGYTKISTLEFLRSGPLITSISLILFTALPLGSLREFGVVAFLLSCIILAHD